MVIASWVAVDVEFSLGGFVLVLVVHINRDDDFIRVAVAALDDLDEIVAKLVIATTSLVKLAINGVLKLLMVVENIVTLVLVASVGMRTAGKLLHGSRVKTVSTVSLDDLALALGNVSVVELGTSLTAL